MSDVSFIASAGRAVSEVRHLTERSDDKSVLASAQLARKTDRLQVYFLGIVIDPINLKPQVLTCAVSHGSSFHEIFRKPVTGDEEGTVLFSGSGKRFPGYAFNPSNLLSQASYPASPTTQTLLRIASGNTERLCGAG